MSKRKADKKIKKSTKESSTFPAWFTNTRLHCLLLFVFATLLYANTITHEYALDDAIVIYDNEFTTQGVAGIDELFKYDTFRGFFKEEGKANLVSGGRYRPFTPAMFALEISLFGQSPMVGHLGNILLYGILCVVLYLVLLQLFKEKVDEKKAIFVALTAALIFAAHPVHTEVVANIKGRDEIMTLLGSLAALYFSIRAWKEGKMLWTVLAALCFFIGLLSKENAITFVGIVPLAFWVFTKASIKDIAVQLVPYFVVAALFLALRASALAPPADMTAAEIERIVNRPKDLMNDPFQKLVGNKYVQLSAAEKTATIFTTLGDYLRILFVPTSLTHDYYPRHVEVYNWTSPSAILSLFLYLMMGIGGLILSLKRNVWGFVLLFYLATLSIVSNLFFPIGTNMAERFLFLPSISFALALALFGYYAAEKFIVKRGIKSFGDLNIPFFTIAAITLIFSVMTVLRNPVWKDNFTLFITDVNISKNSAKLQNSVGGELIAQSRKPEYKAKATQMQTEAVEHLKEAIRIHPGYKNAYLLMGNAYNYLNKYEEAVAAYKNALRLDPTYEEADNNLAVTYREGGKYFGEKKGDIQKSLTFLNESLRRQPSDYETVRLLGVAYGQSGNNPKAIEFFTKATQIEPENAGAWYDLGTAYYFIGNEERRQEYHAKALQIDPKYLENRGK